METTTSSTDGPRRPAPAGPTPPRGALDRALTLIDLLGSDRPRATLSELATASGLSLSTTSRLLGTLTAAGLVQRDATRTYALGPRIVELGRRAAETHATASLEALHPIREDSVAVLRRELREQRETLLRELRERPDGSSSPGSGPARELAAAVAREAGWYDCAVRIAGHPGVLVGQEEPRPGGVDEPEDPADARRWVERLAETRARTLEFIDSSGADAFSWIGTHRRQGPMSVLQCLQEVARGDHEHVLRLQGRSADAPPAPPHEALPSITHERRVLLHHVNMGGVVTTLTMLIYLEEAEAALLRSLGLSDLERRFIRIYFEVQHRRPCFYDDVLTVHLMVSRVGAKSTHYDFTIFNRGAVAAFGRWGLAFRDESGGPATIPPHVRSVLARPEDRLPDRLPEPHHGIHRIDGGGGSHDAG